MAGIVRHCSGEVQCRIDFSGGGSGSTITAYNNHWYNNAAVNAFICAGCSLTSDYNAYESTTDGSNPTETHSVTGTTNYFVNVGTGDFHLASDRTGGNNTHALLAANDNDPDGVARTGATWSMGAFQFAGATPGISFSTSPVSFPITSVGRSSSPIAITVTNTGNANLVISSVGMTTGTNYSQTNNCVTTIAAAGTCTINVTFSPVALGSPLTDSITVSDNAAGSPHTDSVTGATGGSISTGVKTTGVSVK